jgi:hypothetical protein
LVDQAERPSLPRIVGEPPVLRQGRYAGSGKVGKSLYLSLIDQPLPFFDGLLE